MPEHLITSEESGTRLDVLATSLLGQSRSQIQKRIKSGELTLNGNVVTPHLAVNEGDVLQYTEVTEAVPVSHPTPVLEILYEDDDLLVINKQAGLIVHRAHEQDTDPSVVDALLERYPAIKSVGDDEARPGIVHRLDKDVSGVMAIAKTNEAFEHLKQQFQDRTTQKEYLALVYGQLSRDHDRIDFHIARSKTLGRMVARPRTQDGKEAITDYDVIKFYKNTTYVRVNILTGRTHQIRVHFLAIDHPLVGDQLYKKPRMKHIRPLDLGRIFLHAHALTFKLMNGEEKTFSSPLPAELEAVLAAQPVL